MELGFVSRILKESDGTFYGLLQVLNRWELLGLFRGQWPPDVISVWLLLLPSLFSHVMPACHAITSIYYPSPVDLLSPQR